MINTLLKFLESKTTTFEKAKLTGDLIDEIEVYPQTNILMCGNGIFSFKSEQELQELIISNRGGALDSNLKSHNPTQPNITDSSSAKSSPIKSNLTNPNRTNSLESSTNQINQSANSAPNNNYNSTSSSAYSNFHFRDIFGNYHRFFRPYTRTLKPLKVRVFKNAYCYSDSSEILITKDKKALISQTSYITHEFDNPHRDPYHKSKLKSALFIIKQILKWLKFYTTKTHKINGTIAVMHQGTNYFHYLVESISSMLQILQSGTKIDYFLLDTKTPFAEEMVQILQIPESKILPLNPKRLIQATQIALPTLTADVELLEYRDRILWAHALSIPLNIAPFYHKLAQNFHTHKTHKILLTRPKDSNRNIENLAEIEEIFQSFGYEIILPDILSPREQMKLCADSKVIASMHGAGLTNVLFAQDDCIVFEIFSKYYHDFGAQMCALLKNQPYFYMVGETYDTTPHPQKESAYIPPQKLKDALKIIENHL